MTERPIFTDDWFIDLLVATAEWAGLATMPLIGAAIGAASGAEHELAYYGGDASALPAACAPPATR